MEDTCFYSKKNGELCEGCKLCVKGKKLVLFISGVCPRNCWYCPVSDSKFQSDNIYANETEIHSVEEVIKEAKLCSSNGCGITGGDPLTRIDRTCEYITGLKKEFGKRFHIHLYTSLVLVNEKNLKNLYDAGLDEIRFHPDLNDNKFWERV